MHDLRLQASGGEWVLDEEESRPFIRRALELGINFFDTADMYSLGVSEEILGRALKHFGRAARPGRDRHQGVHRHGRRSEPAGPVAQAHHALHRRQPAAAGHRLRGPLPDPPVRLPHADRGDAEALDDVVRAGKALYIGASSMYAWQFAKMLYKADALGLTPLRHHAEPLQPDLPRGGAGDDPAVPRGGHRPDPLEPAGARLPGRQPPAGGPRRDDPRQDRRLRAASCTTRIPTSRWSTA